MRRSFDPAPFNRIFNDPSVRPWMGYGTDDHDLTSIVRNPANVCLLTPDSDGGYLVAQKLPGLYEAHTLALPSARGEAMLELMVEGFAHLFLATDAVEITTFVPDGNRAATRWAERAGFTERFRREAFFPLNGETVGGSFLSLTYAEWVLRDPANSQAGKAFHAQLHAASPSLATHPHDPVHDAFVGAAVRGCMAGNPQKAIGLFNRWAVQAMYQPATLISEHPLLVETGDAVLGLIDGAMRILDVKVAPQA